MTFYDFPWFLKDEDIYEIYEHLKKNIRYVEQLRIEKCYNIRWLRLNFVIPKLTKIYINEVAITINGRNYFFRMFDTRNKRQIQLASVQEIRNTKEETDGTIIKDQIDKINQNIFDFVNPNYFSENPPYLTTKTI